MSEELAPGDDVSALRQAVLDRDLGVVGRLLDRGVSPDLVISVKRSRRERGRDIDPGGFTALHVAAYEDDPELVKLLLARGADGVRPSGLGWLPLELAASWRSPGALRALLDSGVDPNAPSRFGGPLPMAAASDDPTLVEMLLVAGASRGMAHAIKNTCSADGSAAVLRVLLDAGGVPAPADPASTAWSVRVTGLYYRRWECLALLAARFEPETLVDAAIDGNKDRITALLDRGHDVRKRLDYDITAVLCAAIMGHTDVVNQLIDAGAEVDPTSRVRGTPLVEALIRGHLETADALAARGASTARLAESLVGSRCSTTAWAWVFEHCAPADVDSLLARAVHRVDPTAVEVLLGHGANPDGPSGSPHLMHATWTGSVPIVRALLRAGADPRATDQDGRPIMHYVLQYDDVTIECLDNTAYNRNSPMLRSEAVRLLLDAGAPLPWDVVTDRQGDPD